jgi:hypothetical protein
MNPFGLHREAFALVRAKRGPQSEERFARSLRAFDAWLTDPAARAGVVSRAELIPAARGRAAMLAQRVMTAIPDWLRDLHFEAFCQELARYDYAAARMHWRLLEIASRLPALADAVNLATLREQVCQRHQVTADAQESGTDRDRADLLRRAERLLLADAGNTAARALLVDSYAALLADAIALKTAKRQQPRPPAARKRRIIARSPRVARRLQRHLAIPDTLAAVDATAMRGAFRSLCEYYASVGALDTAMRVVRRTRRMFPDDDEVREWKRLLRKARWRR